MIVRAQYTYTTIFAFTVHFVITMIILQTCARVERNVHDVSEQLDMLLNQSFYD